MRRGCRLNECQRVIANFAVSPYETNNITCGETHPAGYRQNRARGVSFAAFATLAHLMSSASICTAI